MERPAGMERSQAEREVREPLQPGSGRPTAEAAPERKRRRRRTLFEYILERAQRPEVILITTWWLIMFGLVVYMGEMGPLLRQIWKPLAVRLAAVANSSVAKFQLLPEES